MHVRFYNGSDIAKGYKVGPFVRVFASGAMLLGDPADDQDPVVIAELEDGQWYTRPLDGIESRGFGKYVVTETLPTELMKAAERARFVLTRVGEAPDALSADGAVAMGETVGELEHALGAYGPVEPIPPYQTCDQMV